MEGNQPGATATGGGMGNNIDDTPLIERVKPSSFVAAGDRLLVHPSSPKITACPGDTRTAKKSTNVPVDEPEQVRRETALPR